MTTCIASDVWLPLSAAQRSRWFLYQMDAGNQGSHNNGFAMRLHGLLDSARLEAAMQELVGRHPMLRAQFRAQEGEPQQAIAHSVAADVRVALVNGMEHEALRQKVAADCALAFDLRRPPLMRAHLYQCDGAFSVLLLVFDHIACDGWSYWQLIEELGQLLGGDAAAALAQEGSYAEYVAWQQEWLGSANAKAQCDYWQKELGGELPVLQMPSDRPRPLRSTRRQAALSIALEPELEVALRALARTSAGTLYTTLLAGWQLLLHRYSGQQEIIAGTPMPARGAGRFDNVTGDFVNPVAVRTRFGADPTVTQLLRSVRNSALKAMANQDFPFAHLVKVLPQTRGRHEHPVFQTMFVFQKARHGSGLLALWKGGQGGCRWGGFEVGSFPVHQSGAEGILALSLEAIEMDSGVRCDLRYDPDLYDAATVARLGRHYRSLLAAMAAAPDARIGALGMLDADERSQQLHTFNANPPLRASRDLMHQMFEDRAAQSPDAVALVDGDQELSYGELNQRANRLAHYLRSLGVKPDDRVAVCLGRGIDMVLAVLATLKAGAAYVPLDPAYPAQRLAYMLTDSAPVALLTDDALQDDLPANSLLRVVVLDADHRHDAPVIQRQSSDNLDPASFGLHGGHLAYVIYTSGSTGQAKGVMNQHAALCNLTADLIHQLQVTPQSRVLQFISFSFDASISEIAMALCSGATLVMAQREQLLPGPPLAETLRRHAITTISLPMMALAALGLEERFDALQTVVAGGEALPPALAAHWAARHRLFNAYGPTEAAVCSTMYLCHPGQDGAVPIGRPLSNVRVYVLGSAQQLLPLGAVGEICIGGAGVARGYLNRDSMSAERFVADPYGAPGARMYRTGDLGRWLPDGNLAFAGRNDYQIKLRGFRIELGEIETALLACDGVREAAVLVREDEPGDRRLVAYVAGHDGDDSIDITELRAALAKRLAEYMLPAAFVVLDAFPLTPNGKLDRTALPAPDAAALAQRSFEPPEGETERTIARIWQDLLNVPAVGRSDHFFEMGGHSLMVIVLIERLRAAGLDADVGAVFAAPTLSALASAVGQAPQRTAFVAPPNLIDANCSAITPELLPLAVLTQQQIDLLVGSVPGGAAAVQDIYPLSALQEGILFHHLLGSAGDAYLLRSALSFDSRARLDAFLGALQQVINRHDILRTAMRWSGLPQPLQLVLRQATLPVHEMAIAPGADALAQLLAATDPRHVRLDLRGAPLMAAHVAQGAGGVCYLSMLIHHIVCDHVTLELILAEVTLLLDGQPLAAPSLPYREFIARTQATPAGTHEAFFTAELGDIDEPCAPFGILDVQDDGGLIEEDTVVLAAPLSAALREGARRHGVSPAVLFHVAWAQVLAMCCGRDDVVFGTVVSGRLQGDNNAAGVLGMFINTLPLRVTLDGRSAADVVAQTFGRLSALLGHEPASLALAQRCSGVAAPLPLFTSLLNYRHSANASGEGIDLGLEGIAVLSYIERNNYPFTICVDDQGQGFSLQAQCARIDPARINGYLVAALEQLSEALLEDSARELQGAPLLPLAERTRVLEQFNSTGTPYAPGQLVHQLFEAQVVASPEAVALECGSQQLTYTALNARANRLAQHLRALGVGPDQRVAICTERSADMVIGLLAILKAGAAYVPIDPAYPAARIAYMLEDCAPVALLTQAALRAQLPGTAASVVLLDDEAAFAAYSADNLDPAALGLTDSHLAYVIYTSGSTGMPKGAMNQHDGVVNRLLWAQDEYRLDATDRVLQKTPFSFDVSVWEFFLPLLAGARLVMARPGGHQDPRYLAQLIDSAAITMLHFVPSMLQVFLEQSEGAACASVRRVLCSGEALSPALAQRFLQTYPSIELHNLYGPTEAAVDVTAWQCQPTPQRALVPIGRPIANARIYILDAHGQPTPVGVAGELHIGGVAVGRGYLNRPELSSERFVADPFADPFSDRAAARMYRTGDLARWLEDGTIEYLGRNDFQVKLRGLRIELGEIEAALTACTGVREAFVLAREDQPGDQRLVAYLLTEPGCSITPADLRGRLAATLAEYMLPSAFVMLDAFPLTPNGKLDRAALPVPELGAARAAQFEAPQGTTEQVVAEVWQQLLGLDAVGRHDHFFELGGHSLTVIRLIEQLRLRGLAAEARALFGAPTVAGMAAAIAAAGATGATSAVMASLVPAGCARIEPGMLPLAGLDQQQIDAIIASVEGGAAAIEDIYRLAPLQQGILFHHLMGGAGDAYLLRTVMAFADRARLDVFIAALQMVIDRHDVLRTALRWEGLDQPVQVVLRQASLPLQELAPATGFADAREQLMAHTDPRTVRLDLTRAPLMAACVTVDAASGECFLALLNHHAVCDHVTIELMLEEISLILAGRADALAAPQPYRSFIAHTLATPEAVHAAWFKEQLGDIDEPSAAFGLLDVHGSGAQVREASLALPAALAASLREGARRHGVTPAVLFHAAWGQVLARCCDHDQAVFGTVLSGRMQGSAGADRVLGMFINTLPIRIDIGSNSVADLLATTYARLGALLEHEQAPLSLAQRCSGIAPSQPLFTSLLNYRHSLGGAQGAALEQAIPGMRLLHGEERTNYPLTVSVDDEGIGFTLVSQCAGVQPERINTYFQLALEALAAAMQSGADSPAAKLAFLPDAEREQQLVHFNGETLCYPATSTIAQLFEEQAQARPAAVAAVFGDQQIRYAALNARANQLAHHLLALGVKADDRVALCLERGVDMLVAMLAVLKAGGAYVPLDASYPRERLAHMLADSAPVAVLTETSLLASLPAATVPVVLMDDSAAQATIAALPASNPDQANSSARNLAYVMYTSGSTGMPKGVAIEQRSVVQLVTCGDYVTLDSDSVIAQASNVSFDAATFEIWGALLNGGKLVGIERECMLTPARLAAQLERDAVSVLFVTTALFNRIAQEAPQCFAGLDTLLFGGELVSPQAVRTIIREGMPRHLLHVYGPTENTTFSTKFEVLADTLDHSDEVPIGGPLSGSTLYVLGRDGGLLPQGAVGELYVGGDGLARHYLNRPDLTEAQFVDLAGQRVYRTGDLVRWNAAGQLVYIGRNDGQIKLRGFRIELGEIAGRLEECSGVSEARVLLREDTPGDKSLVAYLIAQDGMTLSATALRAELAATLADYMIPSAFVTLDAYPLNPNGKLERSALPLPDAAAFGARSCVPPEGETEVALAAIWTSLLGLDQVGRDDHFFELGGHSLMVISLIERMRQQQLPADVRTVYAAPTLRAMARAVEQQRLKPAVVVPANLIAPDCTRITPDLLPLVALPQGHIDAIAASIDGGMANIQDIYPLAPLQEGILFHHLLESEGDAYLLRGVIAFDTRALLERFLSALQQVIDRHDILRTCIRWQGLEQPVQVVLRQATLPVHQLALEAGQSAEQQLLDRTDPRRHRLDLRRAPMLSAFVAPDADNGQYLLAILHHHLVSDHVTMELMIGEVHALLAGQGAQLPPSYPFRNFIAQARSVSDAEHAAFFAGQLGDIDEPTAPFGLLDVQGGGATIDEAQLQIAPALAQSLRRRAAGWGVTPALLFHVAWAQVLARCTGRDDVVFGTVLLGRLQGSEAADSVLGMFMNTLPLRVSLGRRSVRQTVADTYERMTGLMMHEQASLALAQRSSGVAAAVPLFTTLLNFRHSGENKPGAELAGSAWEGMRVMRSEERTNYPITVNVDDFGSGFALKLQCEGVSAARMAAYFETAIAALAEADDAQDVCTLPMLRDEERTLQLETWNRSEMAFPLERTFLDLFHDQVASDPQRLAASCGDENLSYGELDLRAARLASSLIAAGASTDTLVVLMAERGLPLLAMMLAVFKAGAAFLPVDINHPPQRLREIVDASGASLVMASRAALPVQQQVQDAATCLIAEDLWHAGEPAPRTAAAKPADLAYVIFTSGSTGKPKGAMVEQIGMLNHMLGKIATLEIGANDRLAQTASPAFDICVWQFLSALAVGGVTDVVADEVAYDPLALLAAVQQRHITLLQTVPSMMRSLLDVCPADASLPSLRWLVPTGEALTLNVSQEWFDRFPAIPLMNVYGPAECSDDVTYQALTARPQDGDSIAIGRPTPNNRIYILDRHQQMVPVGVAGEICVDGIGVGRGYLNNPEQTAAAFMPHPFAPGQRFYRTGDLGRYRDDGVIDFLGRIDYQVKIRGFRIELGEIESKLCACDGVREAVVLAREDVEGDKRLVAYVVGRPDNELTPAALREQMLQKVAEYMVPAAFVVLDAMPLTPNGKLDRRALPAPDTGALVARTYAAPQGETESAIAAIWAELLGLEQVGRDDNFFELGGHSLLVVNMIERLRQRGLTAEVRMVFSAPTAAGLAAAMQATIARSAFAVPPNGIPAGCTRITPDMLPLVELNQQQIDQICAAVDGGAAAIQDIYPLAPLQEGMLFHHMLDSDGDIYLRRSVISFDTRARLDTFLQALQVVINRHDILRSAMQWQGLPQPVQLVLRKVTLPVTVMALDGAGSAVEQLVALTDPRHMRLDVRRAPLLAACIGADSDGASWHLALLNHHMVSDHVTMDLVIAEIQALLDGQEQQLTPSLPYRNFIAEMLAVPVAVHEAYFRRRLADIDEPTAPFGLLDVQSDGADQELQLPFGADLARAIRERARRAGVAPAVLFHLAWAQVLAKTTNRDDVVFGTIVSGRLQGAAGADRVLGMFINTLPIRVSLSGQPVGAMLADTQRNLGELLEHEQTSLGLAQRCSGVATSVPLFTTVLNYRHNIAASSAEAQAQQWEGVTVLSSEERNNYPITVNIDDDGTSFSVTAQCSGVDPARIARYLRNVMQAMVAAPDSVPVHTLAMLGEEERTLQLDTWNRSEMAFPLERTFLDLFHDHVASDPQRLAATCGDERLSYGELDLRAARLASSLLAAGARTDTLVVLMAERGLPLLAMMLAVFKAGAAFLPVDINHPPQRLREIVDASGASLVMASRAALPVQQQVQDGAACLIAEDLWLAGELAPRSAAAKPADLAYVIFTSGSTGKPKGAMVEQIGMLNHMLGKIATLEIGANDRLAQTASPAFDICVWQFLSALAVGGVTDIVADEVAYDPLALLAAVQQRHITLLQTVPSMMRSLLDVCPADASLSSLRWLVPTGEALTLNVSQEWFERFPAIPLMNVYGPAECSDDVTYQALTARPQEGESIAIGRPTPNNRIYILDRHQQMVPVGVAGEICVDGIGVGRGYLNNPEQTAAAFVPHPFAPGQRFYRTGDLGRYRDDGVIDFLGRMDYQVKIRGFRIELGEIESKLCACDGVREAVVLAREDVEGDKRLVAYVVGRPDTELTPAALREQMLQKVAEYMVPAAFVVLDAMPLTPNGKLDRRALPAPDTGALVARTYAAPQGETEIAIAAIWAELLGLEQVGRTDNFFELGGHSLLAVQLVARLRQQFNAEIALRDVFAQPTVKNLAQLTGASATGQQAPIPLADRAAPLALSWAQQSLWVLTQIAGSAGAAYHMPAGLRLKGRLNRAALQATLDRLLARHEGLRTAFVLDGDRPTQRIAAADCGFALAIQDLRAMSGVEQEAAISRISMDEALAPFDLATGPMIRARLLQLQDDEHILLLTQHHIVTDGWSLGVLVREVGTLYRAFVQGEPDPMAPLALQYADYAQWQRASLGGDAMQARLGYWKQTLGDAPALLELPLDRARPALQSYAGGVVNFTLPPALAAQARALSQRHGCTLFMTLLGAWSVLMARLAGQDDVVIGTPVANRPRPELEQLIGFFVNTLALRVQMQDQPSVAQLLERIKGMTLDAYAHQEVPFELVVDTLRPQRTLSHSPLFQTMLTMNNVPTGGTLSLPELELGVIEQRSSTTHFDVHLTVTDLDGRVDADITYASALFDSDTISRMADQFMRILAAMADNDAQSVTQLPLLSAAERRQVLVDFNDTARDYPHQYPHDQLIHTLFEQQALTQPQAPAVVCDGVVLSYDQLNRRANQVAHVLLRDGVQPDQRVALCVERSVDMIVGLLGILKAGAAYVPMDPSNPAERLAHMLSDCAPRALLTQCRLRAHLPETGVQVLELDGDAFAGAAEHNPAPRADLHAANLAYVIYTSGSTGAAKGVCVEHRAAVNFWHVMADSTHRNCPPQAQVALNASFAFDMSLKGILQLLSGHCLHIVPASVRADGQAFLGFLERHAIDAVDVTPSQLALLLAAGMLERAGHVPGSVLIGGEAIGPAMWNTLQAARRIRFFNMYGPTEATVDATIGLIQDAGPVPSIGRPIANARIYLLDAQMQPVAPGASGEIHIGGAGLARGYLERAQLTAERFIADPFAAQAGERLYKTGDLGRWLPDGSIEYLGRNDFQVKIRGFRIELGEIEARLRQMSGVREAVVLAREDQPGDKRLVAYVVPQPHVELRIAELRNALAAGLAEYMVPSAFVTLGGLPLTANGKLDRAALPLPDHSALVSGEYQAPLGETEIAIAAIWQDLLELENVGRNDDFFQVGGHSILAVQLIHRLRAEFEIDVAVTEVFQKSTLKELAEAVNQAQLDAFAAADVDRLSAELDGLSKEELLALLGQADDQ